MSLFIFNRKACRSACSMLMLVRHGHMMRGKSPGVAKTLAQRLAEDNYEDPELTRKNDIGFPLLKPSRSAELKKRLEHLREQRKDTNLEKLARSNKLEINLDQMKEDWLKTAGPLHIRKIAEHYGVFEHLFGKYAIFTPRVKLDIKFLQSDGESYCPVYHGNRLKPFEAKNAPEVTFDHDFKFSPDTKAKKDSLWTLILTNPDGHLTKENQEYVHWMIGNIPNGDLTKGDLIVPYLQPFPPKGTGHHRHIFVLYKQEEKLDFSSFKVTEPTDLEKRTFNTYEFYRKRQDQITPAGLSFFQANWDDSLTEFYHQVLKMKEPVYDYDYPESLVNDQVKFPHRMPFNLYLDIYNDPKEVNKRFLEEKLAKTHPFEGPEPQMRFPNAHFFNNEPSWLKTEIMKKRLRFGRVNDVEN